MIAEAYTGATGPQANAATVKILAATSKAESRPVNLGVKMSADNYCGHGAQNGPKQRGKNPALAWRLQQTKIFPAGPELWQWVKQNPYSIVVLFLLFR